MFNTTPKVVRFAKHLRVVRRPRWPSIEPILVALLTAFIVGSWAGYALAMRDRVCL